MGTETAQCKCVSGVTGERADPFDIILCDVSRTLPLAHTLPAGIGRRWGAGVPWERATASPKPRRSPAPLRAHPQQGVPPEAAAHLRYFNVEC
jgi:hypothetical protein